MSLGNCEKCGINMDMPGVGRAHRCRPRPEIPPVGEGNVTCNVSGGGNVSPRNVSTTGNVTCPVCEARRARDAARLRAWRARRAGKDG